MSTDTLVPPLLLLLLVARRTSVTGMPRRLAMDRRSAHSAAVVERRLTELPGTVIGGAPCGANANTLSVKRALGKYWVGADAEGDVVADGTGETSVEDAGLGTAEPAADSDAVATAERTGEDVPLRAAAGEVDT